MKALEADKLFGAGPDPTIIGAEGEVLQSVSSTMDVAREALLAGAPDGYVVLADHQTAGRGRDGQWVCPPGRGLLMSVVLTVGLRATEQKLIVILGAVAAVEAARRFGVPARIKWPNDVVVASTGGDSLRVRKLSGMLVERVGRGDAAPAYILGIGLNINQSRDELPPDAALEPTSMRIERGQEFDRNAVCKALLEELNSWYRRLVLGQSERILARWRLRSCLLGERIRARVGGQVLLGKVLGIRRTGELIVEDTAGQQLLLTEERTQLLL